MADTFYFTSYVEGPGLTSNSMGWDAQVTQQYRTQHKAMLWSNCLLARATSVALTGSSEQALIVVPSGYTIWVDHVILGGSSASSGTITLSFGEGVSGTANDWDSSVVVTHASATASNITVAHHLASGDTDALIPYAAAKNFAVKKTSGTGATFDFIEVHGYAYKT